MRAFGVAVGVVSGYTLLAMRLAHYVAPTVEDRAIDHATWWTGRGLDLRAIAYDVEPVLLALAAVGLLALLIAPRRRVRS